MCAQMRLNGATEKDTPIISHAHNWHHQSQWLEPITGIMCEEVDGEYFPLYDGVELAVA